MILNNAKYEAEKPRQCGKRKRKEIDEVHEDRETRRIVGGKPGLRGEDISDTRIEEKRRADEIIGLSRAIASAWHCARAARQLGRLNGNG